MTSHVVSQTTQENPDNQKFVWGFMQSVKSISFPILKIDIERLIYPVIPKSTQSMVFFLFILSVILTASTPIFRIIEGHWSAHYFVNNILSWIGLTEEPATHAFIYQQTETVDKGFSFHALFGCLWLLVSSIQIFLLKSRKGKQAHKIFGYMIQVSFLAHMTAALSLLFMDTQNHHWTMKLLLLSSALNATFFMVKGILDVKKGDIQSHKDNMFKCFVYSIEGAGTIRLAGYLLSTLSLDPTACQAMNDGMTGTECISGYALRLIGTRLLSLYWIGCYMRIKAQPLQLKKHSKEVKSSFMAMSLVYIYVTYFVAI